MTSTCRNTPTVRYRIRIGRTQFIDPHYLVATGRRPRFTSLVLNKTPLSWKSHAVAQRHLDAILETFHTAEIEAYTPNEKNRS